MRKDKPCVLTIAGSDSSGGAGIQADIKTISATGCYAATVITALTAQNTKGVQAIQEVKPTFVKQQLESVFCDLNIKSIKIGMLHNEKIISIVSCALQQFKSNFVVLDPVMVSKSGHMLIDSNIIPILIEKIFPHVKLITPNLIEAEQLLQTKINKPSEQEAAAIEIGSRFKINVLIKGGCFDKATLSDVCYIHNDAQCYSLHTKKIHTKNIHGTGCSLSSAIASYCARDYLLKDAINYAKKYLTEAIQASAPLKIGSGCGPIDHFYFLENKYDI